MPIVRSSEVLDCSQSPVSSLCGMYLAAFRTQSVSNSDNEEEKAQIVHVLLSAHSAEAALYVLVILLVYATIFVLLLHSSINQRSTRPISSYTHLTNFSFPGVATQLVRLRDGAQRICTKSALCARLASKKVTCEPMHLPIVGGEIVDELMLEEAVEANESFAVLMANGFYCIDFGHLT